LGPHSYDPGLSESEVVWSTEIPQHGVRFSFSRQQAVLHLTDVLVFDTFTVPNSLDPRHPIPKVNAVIDSLRIRWSGTTMRRTWTDCVDAFRGEFFEDMATIEVVATTPSMPASACPPRAARNGFRFVSDAAETTISHFAQIGRERNGVFFA
jgi:hypothetical protein